jgi:hypothetical protein
VELYLIIPTTGVTGRCAVVPTGSFSALVPVEANVFDVTPFVASSIVGIVIPYAV